MAYVLIVDDEPDLLSLVEFNLKDAGFETATATSGEEAISKVEQRVPDLVLLDLMLPDVSGAELCRHLRRSPRTRKVPVVMLTAKGEEHERVQGFEAGADDYVVKPFSVKELVLRVKAILRRDAPGASSDVLRSGTLRMDLAAHRCFVGDDEVTLTVLEFRFVQYLLERKGRVQTRDQLLTEVWGFASPLETRTIDTHVMRLREKLGEARAQLETVRGVGYRIVDPE